ncbi:MAG: N-acetylmuramoyl-L-alanine amidase [Anaerolineae bacterium]
MRATPPPPPAPPPGPSAARRFANTLTVILVLVLLGVALLGMGESISLETLAGLLSSRRATVGLLAGHWQNDSGAVCDDGLTEAEINLAVARAVADALRQEGIDVQILPEFDSRLNGFRAKAFVAIHADSCVALSGFKLARMTHSDDPDAEDRLVQTLYRTYADATGLRPHEDTITEDMRQYHALRRISPGTPGAIIEIGFMGGDRHLLTQQQDRVARGIADGIMAFLDESETPATD